MTKQYLDILQKSKARNSKTLANFKKVFLPQKYLYNYLKFIDKMSDESIKNIVKSISQNSLDTNIIAEKTKVLYSYGTKLNELFSKRSAKLIAKYYPNVTIVCCRGCSHCYNAIYKPEEWIHMVEEFFKNR